MKCVVLTLAASATLALMGSATHAATGRGGPHAARGGYSFVSHGGNNSFSIAAARVKERYSRDRYQTHPRSFYNAPSRGVKYYPGGYGYYGGRSGGGNYGYSSRGASRRTYGHYYYERGYGSYRR